MAKTGGARPLSKKKQKILEYLKQQDDKKAQAKAQAKAQPKTKQPPKKQQQEKRNEPQTGAKRVRDNEVEISEEDLKFFDKYGEYSGFLGNLDTNAIKKVVKKQEVKKSKTAEGEDQAKEIQEERGGVQGQGHEEKPKELEEPKPKRPKREPKTKTSLKIIPQAPAGEIQYDADGEPIVRERLPLKTPDGRIITRTVLATAKPVPKHQNTAKTDTVDKNTTQERIANPLETFEESSDEEVIDDEFDDYEEEETDEMKELKQFQQMQETIEKKKEEIALYSQTILSAPESNIEKLQRLFVLCHDPTLPPLIHNIALLSIAAVFKDIIPGYKIMLHNLADVKLSKEKKRIHDYESQLLSTYQDFLGLLEKKSKSGGPGIRKIVAKAAVALLSTHPHFNFRTTLINIVVPLAGIPLRGKKEVEDSHPSSIALKGIEELFANDITTGQATLETVRRIAAFGKQRDYKMNPALIKTFVTLKLSEDVGQINPFAAPPKDDEEAPKTAKDKLKDKKQFMSKKERKKLKKEREIEQELMTASGAVNRSLVTKTQREILRSVFATYFRVIKNAPQSAVMPAVLQGLAQYSHLISVDFLSDLINVLLAICQDQQSDNYYGLIQCCTAVFKTLKAHGDALNVDLKEFYEILYGVLPFIMFSEEQDSWLPLINVLGIMIASDRKAVALERVAAFAKRISTLAMHTYPHLSLSLLYVVRTLLARFPKVQQLLGSEYTYAAGTYNALIDQPDHCGPFATNLWDFSLLACHSHPALAKEAAAIARDDPSAFSAKTNMTEYIFHAYDPMFGGFNPPIPALRKHRYERKTNEKTIFVRPSTQYPTSSFLSSVNDQQLSTQSTPPVGIGKYFSDLRKFDAKKEIFKLKQVLARHKAYKAKRNETKK